jgi:peptidoglycan/xylan/chitin deacetylase (PgdA/CDA1 family)
VRCKIYLLAIIGLMVISVRAASSQAGATEITKWPYGKGGAVSLTFDDGSINQFRVAVPIMDSFNLPATFFIITGEIPGSRYHGTFIGRPTKDIIQETASTPTSADNFFERASAIGFLGYDGTLEYHTQAGETYDEGNSAESALKSYRIIDEAYAKVREGAFKPKIPHNQANSSQITWPEIAALADRHYEFASHTVTHPRLAVLDDANLVYELEKSRQEILDRLGSKHTFSVECPYGTENERAVRFALARYQLARNRMPDAFVEDIDRFSDADPISSKKEYVRWQRGALTETSMGMMQSWVDVTSSHDNIWLVLVFHGVEGVGWKPKTGSELKEYFGYIKSKEDKLWVATFQDVAKYMRERMHSGVRSYQEGNEISIVLRDDLTEAGYDLPLTLKTQVPVGWHAVQVRQGDQVKRVEAFQQKGTSYVLYQAVPNAEVITLDPAADPVH